MSVTKNGKYTRLGKIYKVMSVGSIRVIHGGIWTDGVVVKEEESKQQFIEAIDSFENRYERA